MSELALYVVATVVVLAGVAYFFVKQREQEALSQRKPARGASKQKAKKETKEPKEPRENRTRKPRPVKEEAPVVPLTKKQRAAKDKEEDEAKGVLEFLKGKKFSTEKTGETAQAKVRSAPPPEVKKAAPKAAKVESDSESGSDSEEYEKVKRKIKTSNPKEKAEEEPKVEDGAEKKTRKSKPKFFTKQEAEEHEAAQKAAKADRDAAKAEREARKNRPPGEKRERRVRTEAEEGEFRAQRERRQRRERTEGENGQENGDDDRRKKFPAREPDQAPVFASEYEAADMDNILNSLTSYYNANPEANRSKPKQARKQPEAEDSKAEVADE